MGIKTIRQLREAAGLTQAELATRAGVSTSTIERYEDSNKDFSRRGHVLITARIAANRNVKRARTRLDLCGQRYARLTVIERAPIVDGKSTRWVCQCDCGNQKIVDQKGLRSGKTRSCGCLRGTGGARIIEQSPHLARTESFEIYQARKAAGLTQKELAARAGITVPTLRTYEQGRSGNIHKRKHVLKIAREAERLRPFQSRSPENPRGTRNTRLDLVNQQYGRLTVIDRAFTAPGTPLKWECRCDCGGMKTVLQHNLRAGRTRSCGCLQKENAGRPTNAARSEAARKVVRELIERHQRASREST